MGLFPLARDRSQMSPMKPRLGSLFSSLVNGQDPQLEDHQDTTEEAPVQAAKPSLFPKNNYVPGADESSTPTVQDYTKGQSAPGQDFSYGAQHPNGKIKWWQQLLNIALPAVAAAGNGQGLANGAIEGYFNNEAAKSNKQAAADKDFDQERTFRQKDALERDRSQLEADKLGQQVDYQNKSLGISRQNANTSAFKAHNPTAKDPNELSASDYLEAKDAVEKAKKLGVPPPPRAQHVLDYFALKLKPSAALYDSVNQDQNP